MEEKHRLITRTEAKDEFLLKDCDLDLRQPPLRFLLKKNPYNSRWGDMKLYLRVQAEKRALDVWDSLDNIEAAREKRSEKQSNTRQKQFERKMKELRRTVTVNPDLAGSRAAKGKHSHRFGEETYDEGRDLYCKKCLTCDHVAEYEKM